MKPERAIGRCCQAALLLAISGCAILAPGDRRWPADLPSYAFFAQAYASDPANARQQSLEDYLSWIYRFYKGWIAYAVGWLDISAGVVASLPAHESDRVGAHLDRLGRDIAAEWAKASEGRVVDNSTLAAWGEALTESVNRGEVAALLERIDADLASLHARELSPRDITAARYYPDIDDGDPFGPFSEHE